MNDLKTSSGSLTAAYFEEKFRDDIDPWRFRTSDYERGKYEATVRAFAKHRYQSALEVGCAIGVLSAIVAPRCAKLLSLDGSQTAIAEAKRQALPNVRFETAYLPEQFPEGSFDLILLSEVLYYFSKTDLKRLSAACVEALDDGGEIILCHWLGETDYPLTGRCASDLFVEGVATRRPVRQILHEGIYRLERLSFPSRSGDGEG